ncbi:phospholipase D-like domain-containing protein [Klebsiella pneumoniae]|uniref:phospholipase D-like domain-containing protein n=1 Tax=Klebsiella pneumoniae TaxID=573 RepID=UPI001F3E3800|nr:phospholipase D-like domain-containing protein [Klebsiella pneumoniae]MDV5479848.1 phospholipase D-like domain-containing protein [Klebsiella pneumoniae]MDV5609442.1 phospholipase D-like domain-containing protein [Klebsiella pneumoniae]
MNRTLRRCCLSGLISLSLFAPFPVVYADSIETGYSPEGTALQLVLKTINSAQQEIRLMGYSFTSPEVAGALVRAKRRGVDVKVVLDWKANTGKQNQASLAAMNLLVNAGIPVRTVSQYKIMHDKVIIAGVLGIFRPKTTKCSGGPAVCGLQRGITFFEIPIWALFE